jgi:hypothetical protein
MTALWGIIACGALAILHGIWAIQSVNLRGDPRRTSAVSTSRPDSVGSLFMMVVIPQRSDTGPMTCRFGECAVRSAHDSSGDQAGSDA